MPPRSWLTEAKSIHDLGSHFYVPKPGAGWNDRRAERADSKWLERLRMPLPVTDADRPYFGSAMHDSSLIGIERAGRSLRVRLDARDSRIFARMLSQALDRPFIGAIWPVDLVLDDVRYVRAARMDRTGALSHTEWEGLGEKRGGTPTEFLYDWFHGDAGRLQWIAQLWPRHEHRENRPNDVYLMVDCAKATAEDRCPEAFERAYGPGARILYNEYRNALRDQSLGFSVFEAHEIEAHLRRRMAAHGLTRADFLPILDPG